MTIRTFRIGPVHMHAHTGIARNVSAIGTPYFATICDFVACAT